MDKVRFENITAGYTVNPLFSEIHLSIEEKTFTALTGPNGSGKSTLLKLIYKELKAYEGVVYLNGADVEKIDQKSLARQIGFVSQHGENGYAFTVREAVAMGRYA
ncbi:MAG: ABC transporter ATP-binding protein, partial [Sphaerochaeta sp.]